MPTELRTVIFAGPTLPAADVARLLPGARIEPPAARGDVLRAALGGAQTIGLIDGYFEHQLAVQHKEVLWALKQGVCVYGGASMGALRASELDRYGMVGVGRVYEAFASGALEHDDEVAVVHGPPPSFPATSTALVNIRASLAAARAHDIIEPSLEQSLVSLARDTFYPERSYLGLLERARREGLDSTACASLEVWLADNKVDQKRLDAVQLLEQIARMLSSGDTSRPRADWDFPWSSAWDILWNEVRRQGGQRP